MIFFLLLLQRMFIVGNQLERVLVYLVWRSVCIRVRMQMERTESFIVLLEWEHWLLVCHREGQHSTEHPEFPSRVDRYAATQHRDRERQWPTQSSAMGQSLTDELSVWRLE